MTRTQELIERIILLVAELPGRSSPDDQPNMMLVTDAELREILSDELQADTTKKPKPRTTRGEASGTWSHV
jgi:hypothetical protein